MGHDLQTSETVSYCTKLCSHRQRLSEILECFIVSSVVKDCLVLSQYDWHHGSFLLVTTLSSYKSTIIQC